MSTQVKYVGKAKCPYLYFQSYKKGKRSEQYLGSVSNPLAWEKAAQCFMSYLEDRLKQFELDLINKIKEHILDSSAFALAVAAIKEELADFGPVYKSGAELPPHRARQFLRLTGLLRGRKLTQVGKEVLLSPYVIDSFILEGVKEKNPIYLEELHMYIAQLLERRTPRGSSVRIPTTILRDWKKRADAAGVSLSSFIIDRVEDFFMREEDPDAYYLTRGHLIRDNDALRHELQSCRDRLHALQST